MRTDHSTLGQAAYLALQVVVERLARLGRGEFESAPWEDFPEGCCSDLCDVLLEPYRILFQEPTLDKTWGHWQDRELDHPHCWLESAEWVVDPTHGQFVAGPFLAVFSKTDDLYRAYRDEAESM